jgi:hypothetical protein
MARKKKPTPKTQDCTQCGYKRKFVQMRQKEGKDGRIARWPEYEKCPRKFDPQYHPTSANTSAAFDEQMRKGSSPDKILLKHTPLPAGVLYTTVSTHAPLDGLAECLLDYEEKVGGVPVAIGVRNPGVAHEAEQEIRVLISSGEHEMKILGREISGDGALRLVDMAENLLRVVKLSDVELGAELIDKVWADMPISSWESARPRSIIQDWIRDSGEHSHSRNRVSEREGNRIIDRRN